MRIKCFRCVSSAGQKPEEVIKKYMEEVRGIPDEVRVTPGVPYLLYHTSCLLPQVFY